MRRRRRPTLHHAVKDKRVTVLGPVKQPEMDFMSHRGAGVGGVHREQGLNAIHVAWVRGRPMVTDPAPSPPSNTVGSIPDTIGCA